MARFTPLAPVLISNLARMAKAYVAREGCKLASLSRYAHGDPSFFDKIVNGSGGCSLRKYDEVMTWFQANWPDGMEWPDIWLPDDIRVRQAVPRRRPR